MGLAYPRAQLGVLDDTAWTHAWRMLAAMPNDFPPARRALSPHPACERGGVGEFTVKVRRASASRLELEFLLRAVADTIEVPRPRAPVRADGLWHHTCFEVFVSRGQHEYREYNFAPSGAWAAYGFANYRAGMAALEESPSEARWRVDTDSLGLNVVLDSDWFAGDSPGGVLRVGCSAVIENRSGALSYWALRHPPGKPDFHDAAAFIVELR